MAIPLATTTISVLPGTTSGDPYESQPSDTPLATGIRAHISVSAGEETVRGGQQVKMVRRLACDPVEMTHTNRILDETTGNVWHVGDVEHRVGLGLDHVQAVLTRTEGAA